MKVAPVIVDAGRRETGEILLIIDRAEGVLLVEAVTALAAQHPRRITLKKLLAHFENLPVY